MIKTKRVYDKPDPDDGLRLLIMRRPVWINRAYREFQSVEGRQNWKLELSPSNSLLDSYKNGIIDWSTFRTKFPKELENSTSISTMRKLGKCSETMNITLLCQEFEGENCHRHIIKDLIQRFSVVQK